MIVFGSVCSGIEAASVAWLPLGWRAAFLSEISPAPRAVLKHRHPGVPLRGDFTEIQAGDHDPIDLLVGGTPCQSFSIAGLRGGLADARGNLAVEFLRLADRLRPRWVVWENVPGVLSSTSHDAPDPPLPPDDMAEGSEWVGEDEYDAEESHAFSCFLAGLSEVGYGWAYRSFDAQYFGLAQRRERVFVVGYLGDWRRAAAVLFEPEGLRGDPAPRRETGKAVAGAIAASLGGSDDNDAANGRLVARTLTAHPSRIDGESENLLVGTLCNNGKAAGSATRQDAQCGLLIVHRLRAEGYDASEDGTGRGTPLIPVSVALRGGNGGATAEIGDGLAYALRASTGGGDKPHVLLGAYRVSPNDGAWSTGDRVGALTSGTDPSSHVLAFSCKDDGADAGVIAPTLRAMGHNVSHANAGGQVGVAFAQNQRDEVRIMEVAGALSAEPGAKQQTYASIGAAVRRLTPRECERLQGFPDDYTLVPYRGGMMADGPRYKALGNSMAVPCMAWIGRRIAAEDASEPAGASVPSHTMPPKNTAIAGVAQ